MHLFSLRESDFPLRRNGKLSAECSDTPLPHRSKTPSPYIRPHAPGVPTTVYGLGLGLGPVLAQHLCNSAGTRYMKPEPYIDNIRASLITKQTNKVIRSGQMKFQKDIIYL